MQAAFLTRHGGPEVIEVGELPRPQMGSQDVLVRIRFAALNHLDLWVREGLPHLKLTYPHILGGDASGTVEMVGKEVTTIKPGDEVLVHPGLSCRACSACLSGWESLCPQYRILGEHLSGTNAEYVCVPYCNVFPKPPMISFEEAAAIPLVFTTAWQMLVKRAKVKPGDLVLIHGAGSGVSSAAIQIAALYGAEIVVTSSQDQKLAEAKRLGAHHTINYRNQDFLAEVKKIAKRGVDIVIDHVGKDFWEKNIRVLKWGGCLVTCGATSGAVTETDLRHLFFSPIESSRFNHGIEGRLPGDFESSCAG